MPVMQMGTAAIIKNAIAGNSTHFQQIKFSKPFAASPQVWVNGGDVIFNAISQGVTNTGFELGLRNVDPNPNIKDVFPQWFAYGKLA